MKIHSGKLLTAASAAVLVLVFCGCRQRGSVRDATAPMARPADSTPHLVVRKNSKLLYSFFDRRAELATVDQLEQVADTARKEVLVTDPTHDLAGDMAYIADVSKLQKGGTYRSWIEPRSAWYDRNMPKLSMIAKSSADSGSPSKHGRRPRRHGKSGRPGGRKRAQVIVFSTAWCPSCKAAKQYFQAKGIRFQDLDVEKDPQANQQYMAVVQKAGLKPRAVPVIIVNGRVFQGFSQQQIDAALSAGPA